MRFSICCRCNANEKKKTTDEEEKTGRAISVVPTVTEQPKPSETIQLDRITEVSVQESSVEEVQKEETPPPVTRRQPSIELVPPTEPTKLPNVSQALNPPAGTNIIVECTTKRGEACILPFTVVEPGHYHCSYEGKEFTILNDQIQATDGAEDDIDTKVILWNFAMALLGVQQSRLQMQQGVLMGMDKSIQAIPQTYVPPSMNVNTGNSNSMLNYTVNIGKHALTLDQMKPGHLIGTYKGKKFTVTNGQLQSKDGDYNQLEKELIMNMYFQCMIGMQQGVKRMEAGIAQFLPSSEGQQHVLRHGTPININITTKSGEKSVIPLTFIEPGHFRGTYDGIEFTILNGEILTDSADDELDKELILSNYTIAVKGMENGLLRMRQGLLGMNAGGSTVQPEPSVPESAQHGLGIMRALIERSDLEPGSIAKLIKKIENIERANNSRIVDGDDMSNVPQPVHQNTTNTISYNHRGQYEQLDTTAQHSILAAVRDHSNKIGRMRQEMNKEAADNTTFDDEVDGQYMSNIPEPILQKTTFTPNAILYDDPKEYEQLDKNEIPPAKRADEYIISLDENVKAGNRYYFHAAKPSRVTRKELTPKQHLQIASLERYRLFEKESLKVHNEYRKLHGVPPLVHNEFLCQVAKEWAEHLALKNAFYHRPKNDYGENLYRAVDQPVSAKKAVAAWYDEIDIYDYNNPTFSKETGHFTQLVWKDTREMGTGVAQLGDAIWVCCNYHPQGNHLDKFNDEFIPRPLVKRVPKS